MHLNLPEHDDRDRQQAKVHADVNDAEDRTQLAGRVTLWSSRELSCKDDVETGTGRLTLEDVQEKGKQGVNEKREEYPIGNHPSFGSEPGDAHVETGDGHLDNLNRDEKVDPSNSAELFEPFSLSQSNMGAAVHLKSEHVVLMVRYIIYVFPYSSVLNHHDLEYWSGRCENLPKSIWSTPVRWQGLRRRLPLQE